jgi:hypothetical protein
VRFKPGIALCSLIGMSLIGVAACGDPPDERAGELGADAEMVELEEGQLGLVHVLIQPNLDELEPEPALQVQARFVEYRGMSQEFVRDRTDMPLQPVDILEVGRCAASQTLISAEASEDTEVDLRELSYVDVGDLRLEIGRNEVVLPMALVPDVLPYVSGVEYFHADDALPDLATMPDGRAPIHLHVEGRRLLSLASPQPIELTSATRGARTMAIDWEPPGARGDAMTLRLQGFAEDAPVGDEVTCLVADSGHAALDQSELTGHGLALDSDLVRVTAVRAQRRKAELESFGEMELIVEVRDQALLPLTPRPQ